MGFFDFLSRATGRIDIVKLNIYMDFNVPEPSGRGGLYWVNTGAEGNYRE